MFGEPEKVKSCGVAKLELVFPRYYTSLSQDYEMIGNSAQNFVYKYAQLSSLMMASQGWIDP
jgi:hypothetical protein